MPAFTSPMHSGTLGVMYDTGSGRYVTSDVTYITSPVPSVTPVVTYVTTDVHIVPPVVTYVIKARFQQNKCRICPFLL
jgi:hypothetical protein